MKRDRGQGKKKRSLTHFQLRVLEETAKIPLGEVRTYKWIARRIGSPKAVRAVGSALKKNPYTLIIPCHRVIKSNGDIGGYSRGRHIKASLIEFERTLKKYMVICRKAQKNYSIIRQ